MIPKSLRLRKDLWKVYRTFKLRRGEKLVRKSKVIINKSNLGAIRSGTFGFDPSSYYTFSCSEFSAQKDSTIKKIFPSVSSKI